MKLYKYWVREYGVLQINGATPQISCFGGSNQSLDDAKLKALEKIAAVQKRVQEGRRRADESYDVEIREEIIQEVNSQNIVSRNRYGALVLNSADTLFIDIDEPPIDIGGFFKSLFSSKRRDKKQSIIEMIRKKAQGMNLQGMALRLYETSKGVRVIVSGRLFDPRSSETQELFRRFNADRLYAYLCKKQNCFRARLTPKPSRAKCSTPKVSYPRTPDEQAALDKWLAGYNQSSASFSVCRFIDSIGMPLDNAIVSFHDSITKAHTTLPLA